MRIAEITRRPVPVLLLALLVTAVALYPASQLRIRADLLSLLPEGSPAADDYRLFLERFGGREQVFVLILPAATTTDAPLETGKTADAADLADAAGRLEEILADSPEVAHVRAGLEARDEELFSRWVAPRAPLLLGDDWQQVVAERIEPTAITRQVARLRATLATPAGAAEALLARGDPLGFRDLLPATTAAAGISLDPLTSTFRSDDGGAALVMLMPARAEIDPQGGRALAAELEQAYAEVRSQLEVELDFHALGGPLYAAQDETLLRRDLERTLTVSLLLTTGILVATFGGLRMPLTVVIPLLAGLVWTAGVTGLLRDGVSGIAIGFGAVLVGLGIDYGIHGATRFRQAYLTSADGQAAAAFAETVRHVGPPILTSAATTATGFAVLGFAHLPPLRELGLLVALGLLAILLAMATAGGAAWVVATPRLSPPGAVWRWLGHAGKLPASFATKRPKLVLAVAATLTLAAAGTVGGLAVDPDVRTLRPVDHPAHEAEKLLSERFGIGLDTATVVVRGDDTAAALAVAEVAADELRQALLRTSPDAMVSSPADLLILGEPLAERLTQLATLPLERAADDLERELTAANLNPRAFDRGLAALRALGRGEDPGAPPAEAWPEWLGRSLVRDEDGTWAALSVRLPPDTWPDGPPPELIEGIRVAAPGAALASAVAIGAELRELAAADLRNLALLALAAVATVVTLAFRGRLGASLLAGLPVILGSLWTLALWTSLDRSLDLFTLAVLPILLGIGIDDGLHVVHGAAGGSRGIRDGSRGIRGSVDASCRALTLTTLTTCAGFGSLVFSRIPGLRNGGLLIAVGVFLCLVITLTVLPAIAAVRSRS